MKIKTFKKTKEKEINEFLENVRVLNNGVYQTDETITFTYFEGKYPQYRVEEELSELNSHIAQNTKQIATFKRDLEYINRKDSEETDGVDKRTVQASMKKLELDTEIMEERIKELTSK